MVEKSEWFAMSADKVASPWLLLPVCSAVALLGIAVALNFKNLPKRQHDRLAKSNRGSDSSFDFQRMIGAIIALGGLYGITQALLRILR
jgi:hypothetical protein